MKKYITILSVLAVLIGGYYLFAPSSIRLGASILFPQGGGTGIGSATAGDVGKVLTVSDDSPFTYTLSTASGGGASADWVQETNFGVQTLTASTSIALWAKSAIYASSTLNVVGLSTFTYASTTALSISSLASGNCLQSGTGGLVTSTGSACGAGGGGGGTGWASTTDATSINFTGSSNVGIGTTTPMSTLTVTSKTAQTANVFQVASSTNTYLENFITVAPSGTTTINNLNTGAIKFETNAGVLSAMDMTVTSSASAGTIESYAFQNDASTTMTIYSESDGAGGIRNQRVGIGTTTPTAVLSIVGGIASQNFPSATGGTNQAVCYTSTSGLWVIDTTGTCVVSSERFKENVKKLTVSSLDILKGLRVVSYSPIADDTADYKNVQYGFIAEQVAGLDPHLARYGADGLPRTLDDRGILAIIVDALQKILAKITGLEARMDAQDARIKALEARLK